MIKAFNMRKKTTLMINITIDIDVSLNVTTVMSYPIAVSVSDCH